MLVSRCDAHRRYTRGCPDCQARAVRYRRIRLDGLADGTWASGKVTGEELERVRQHVRGLTAVVGVGGRRVALVAGVSHHSVDVLLVDGAVGMHRPVAEALLGVTVQACLALIDNPRIPVDPTGTMRFSSPLYALAPSVSLPGRTNFAVFMPQSRIASD